MAIEATNAMMKRGKKKNTKANQFSKKQFYNLHVPSFFKTESIGKTLVKPHNSAKILERRVLNRTFEVHQNQLNEGPITRKYKFMINKLKGNECHSVFAGMKLTSERRGEIAKRWHTLIEGVRDVETTDGFKLRFEIAATTKRNKNSTKKTCYAKRNEVKELRQLMFSEVDKLKDLSVENIVSLLNDEKIGSSIEKQSKLKIQDCSVLKVKVLRNPLIGN